MDIPHYIANKMNNRHAYRGFSLIEVLVALVVLAIGMSIIAVVMVTILRGVHRIDEHMYEMQNIYTVPHIGVIDSGKVMPVVIGSEVINRDELYKNDNSR